MKIFGWQFRREVKDELTNSEVRRLPSDSIDDGSLSIGAGGNYMSYGVNFETAPVENEVELITNYREIANQPEIEKAVDDIINEFFSYDEDNYPVELNLDAIEEKILSEKTREKIREEFKNILELLNFRTDCYEMVRRWYTDGRLYYQKIIDPKDVKGGLKELRYIDPRKIKKIKEEIKNKSTSTTYEITEPDTIEYFLYNPNGINPAQPNGMKLTTDSVAFVHSGLFDKSNSTILSYLHKAIRPYNLLRQLEDSTVIYTIVRSPERRVFNIEVGNMPPMKAEQHVKEQMHNHRRKMVYDPVTGKVRDDRRYMSLLEDYWFPKRDGKGTSIDTIGSSANFGDLANLDYFRKKLYESLNVPYSRFDGGATTFGLGKSSEITRDELKFAKFINRLRKRFSALFDDLLSSQLVLKGILTFEEWEIVKSDLVYDYLEDNFFTELKWSEIWQNRISNLGQAEILLQGGYASKKWVRQNILQMSEDDYNDMKKDIDAEQAEELKKQQLLNQPEEINVDEPIENDAEIEEDPIVNEKLNNILQNNKILFENLNKMKSSQEEFSKIILVLKDDLLKSKQENISLQTEMNKQRLIIESVDKKIEDTGLRIKSEDLLKRVTGV